MAQFRISQARLKLIKDRQWEDRWFCDYVAGMWATPAEAPGISTGSILRPRKVGGREFHTLSAAETFVALLALHHPNCWEVQEQRVMFPAPRPHVLFGHPRASGLFFKPFAGTIEIAERLGMRHPKVRLRLGEERRLGPMAPFPYLGDLLLFMEDVDGPYPLNWPVKNKFADFRGRGPGKTGKTGADYDGTIKRQLLEKHYFESGAVRTQPVSRDQMPNDLCWNLRELFLDDTFPLTLPSVQRIDVVEEWRDAIGRDVLPHVTARSIARKHKAPEREVIAILRQALWRRELRVDLFRPIQMDRPLRPEVVDVLVRYAHWFAR